MIVATKSKLLPVTIILLAGIFVTNSFCTGELTGLQGSIRTQLVSKLKFTTEQVKDIERLIKTLDDDRLSTEYVQKKINEGVAKKASFAELRRVVSNWVNAMKIAAGFVRKARGNGLTVRDEKYCVQLFAECLQRGYDIKFLDELEKESKTAGVSVDNLLHKVQDHVLLVENGVSNQTAKLVISWSIKMQHSEFAKYMDLITFARKNGVEGGMMDNELGELVRKKKSFGWFKQRIEFLIKNRARDEVRSEVLKDKNKENRK
ncbi:MAG: hypothetical protein WC955_05165 [Elusimicrobiota bacterium]